MQDQKRVRGERVKTSVTVSVYLFVGIDRFDTEKKL